MLKASPRVAIETPRLRGSIALKGAQIDDLALTQYHETVDPNSPPIVLLSPAGSPHPFYAEFGWVGGAGAPVKAPDGNTVWTQQGSGHARRRQAGDAHLRQRRRAAVPPHHLGRRQVSVHRRGPGREQERRAGRALSFGLIRRHGTPETRGYYILHEGLIGVLGDNGLQEFTYKTIEDKKNVSFKATNAWLGITDKYWAATLIPDTKAPIQAQFSYSQTGTQKTYQTDYLGDAQTIAPGATGATNARLFAGAKEVAVVDGYEKQLGLNRFDLLIDWGWFYFITKPMFYSIDWIYQHVGNFGIAILLITVLHQGRSSSRSPTSPTPRWRR